MKKSKRVILMLFIALIILPILSILSGCSEKKEESIRNINQLNNSKYTVTLDAGSVAAQNAKKAFPKAKFTYAKTAPDAYLAVSNGKADAFVYGKLYMQYAIASQSFDNLKILDGVIDSADIAAGINPSREDLIKPINDFIKQIKSDGTFDDMYNRWVVNADDTMPEIKKAENPDKTIRFGTSGLVIPMNYYGDNNEITGFDIEFMKRLALYLNADYTFEVCGFDALVASLQANRLDVVVTDLNITDERKEVINFSDPYFVSETAVVVRKSSNASITSLDDINGKKIGVLENSSYTGDVERKFPKSDIKEFKTNSELLEAIKSGGIDTYIIDEPMAQIQKREIDGISIIDDKITNDVYGFALNFENKELCESINEILKKYREDGTLNKLQKKWIDGEGEPEIKIDDKADKSNGTLEVCLSSDSLPFAYKIGDDFVGYDVELIRMIANDLGYDVNIIEYDFNELISGIVTKRADIAVGLISYTSERAKTVLFTDSTYESGSVAVVLNKNENNSFFTNLKNSFNRTFVKESRYKIILNGLLVTIELSIMTLLFGTALGFAFSFMLRSKNNVVKKSGIIISRVLDGLPLLVILMVLFYLVFSKTSVPAIIIGVIGLSMDFANTVAGILNTGVGTIDKGQIEAAVSMGYSRWQTFIKIIFPQAVSNMFSQYTGAVISMVKGTSIIGYITISDLTKAGDIIRSLTYEAFFPLIVTAIIYFIIARIFVVILEAIAKKINPKYRKRKVKGVILSD